MIGGSEPLTRRPGGEISLPMLYFDPERWSAAYSNRKHCGYVFSPNQFVELVALATRIVFYEQFKAMMSLEADHLCKTMPLTRLIKEKGWIKLLKKANVCPKEYPEDPMDVPLVQFDENDIKLPNEWRLENRKLALQLANELNQCLPDGLAASDHDSVAETIGDLCSFIDAIESGGKYVNLTEFDEKKNLQSDLRDCLIHRGVDTREGTELGGGETDLIVRRRIVIECKKKGKVTNPLKVGPTFAWQARRYAINLCSEVAFVVLAFKPSSEKAILQKTQRIAIHPVTAGKVKFVEIRFVVPWGQDVPSHSKHPKVKKKPSRKGKRKKT